jgi:hypothetical protein
MSLSRTKLQSYRCGTRNDPGNGDPKIMKSRLPAATCTTYIHHQIFVLRRDDVDPTLTLRSRLIWTQNRAQLLNDNGVNDGPYRQ